MRKADAEAGGGESAIETERLMRGQGTIMERAVEAERLRWCGSSAEG